MLFLYIVYIKLVVAYFCKIIILVVITVLTVTIKEVYLLTKTNYCKTVNDQVLVHGVNKLG